MENLKLSDKLALDRTLLANERTLLAYLRIFIGMVGTSGASTATQRQTKTSMK